MDYPNEKYLTKTFVQEFIKKKYEESAIWENYTTKTPCDALSVLWYQEAYIDIETVNDTALSAPIDSKLKRPAFRAGGSLFATTKYDTIEQKNAALYQLALQGSVTEEAVKYTSMLQPILRMQTKLANSMASEVNRLIMNTMTENWTPSLTQTLTASTAWNNTANDSIVPDILDAVEKIEDLSGYNYKADMVGVSKQTYFDIRKWAALNDYELSYENFRGETKVPTIEGLKLVVSNHIKRDTAIVMDNKVACTVFESQPVMTDTYFNKPTREYNFQIMKTFYPALTDPKAICTITNLDCS